MDTTSTPEYTKVIRKPALKRLCRRAGIKRLDNHTYGEIRSSLHDHLKSIVRQSILVMKHSHRKTVTAEDVLFALKNSRVPLYGI
jgi:histone H4